MTGDGPRGSKPLIWFGVMLTLLGLIGLAIFVITPPAANDFAKTKSPKGESQEQHPDPTPPTLSVVAVALGIILTGVGSSYARS